MFAAERAVQELEREEASGLLARLPRTIGRMRAFADLAKTTWFQVGGPAEVLFRPEHADDLATFLRAKPADVPVLVLGVGSNLLVRDGGVEGVVIRLGRGFTQVVVEENIVIAGAGAMGLNAAETAAHAGLQGLEFLSGIPGTVGGALAMNAGAYGKETADVLLKAEAISPLGEQRIFTRDELQFRYRHSGLPEGWVFTRAWFQAQAADPEQVRLEMQRIQQARESTQPIRSRTGGSTFKNPPAEAANGRKAWQLIDEAGCRGMVFGGAQVSEKHCNFLINTGNATAHDIEQLGEAVRDKVEAKSGIRLEWEIRRIGKALEKEPSKILGKAPNQEPVQGVYKEKTA